MKGLNLIRATGCGDTGGALFDFGGEDFLRWPRKPILCWCPAAA